MFRKILKTILSLIDIKLEYASTYQIKVIFMIGKKIILDREINLLDGGKENGKISKKIE